MHVFRKSVGKFASVLAFLLVAAAGSSSAAAAEKAMSPEECLMCHGGSFEALRKQTENWKDDFGDKVQPHVWLDPNAANPHASKVLPVCTDCHKAHPVPPPKDYSPEKANLSLCYGCHHMENFQKCTDAGCHEK